MRAMAIRIRFLRKMSRRMMTTSTMARMITGGRKREMISSLATFYLKGVCMRVT